MPIYFETHGTGEALLLLHGFSGSSQDWLPSAPGWGPDFQIILPDLRGHGRSGILPKPFRHEDAATDIIALLDRLGIRACKGVGVSGGGNVLLHLATRRIERIKAMVLVSATPYFPPQARPIMSQYADSLPEEQREFLRRRHSGGDPQVRALLESTKSFATSYDDMNFTPPYLSTIQARTLIVQGDRDPLYPLKWRERYLSRNSGYFPTGAMGLSWERNGPTFIRLQWLSCANDSISSNLTPQAVFYLTDSCLLAGVQAGHE